MSTYDIHLGELRFGKRFSTTYAGRFLHVHGIGWHEYDGTRWAECLDGAEHRAMYELLKVASKEAKALTEDAKKLMDRDISRVQSWSGTRGALNHAGVIHPCTLAAPALDSDGNHLNTMSGTVNIDQGTVASPRPGDHLSKVTRARFNPDARSLEFDQFLERIQPDPEMRRFLARQVGASIHGTVREHKLYIWFGLGANGKGTLRDAIRHALGDYAVEVSADLLLQSKYGGSNLAAERMRLKGTRIAFCSEIANGAKLDEAIMKKLTGGDPVNAKLLYKNPIEFDPSHTLFMLTNHLPVVRGDDPATWRRILAIPFEQVIPENERDGTLPERLKAAPDAVLAWIWAGWMDYQSLGGLKPPASVLEATRQYQAESDLVFRFVNDEDAVLNGHGSITSGDLYNGFIRWCSRQGEPDHGITNKAFTQSLENHGFRRGKRTNRGVLWQGLMLAVPQDEDEK